MGIWGAGMSKWQETTLGDAFNVNPKRDIKRGAVTPFIPMDALPEHARQVARIERREFVGSGAKFRNRDTLLARITPCLENGKTAFVTGLADNEVAHGSTEYIVISGKDGLSDDLFAYYLARLPSFRSYAIASMEGTSGRQRVPNEAVARYKLELPPLVEQRAIAHILGTLDDKIELNRRINETLQAMARAIFQSWFVDFDPVRAKANGESADSICQRLGLTPELLALFPDSFQDSELGEIPKGWKTASLSEIAEVIMGQSPSGDTYNELGDGMPLINGPVEFGSFHPVKRKWTTNSIRQSEYGDLIVCVRGSTTGKLVKSDGVYCLGRGVAAIRSRTGNQPYVDRLFEQNLERMLTHATGSTFPSWSGPTLKQWTILLPPERLILEYCEVAAPLAKLSDALAHEVNFLVETRDGLLPKFLSGSLPCTFSELNDEPA